jgi:tetratricopeptide (TPR) repeat protein
VERREQAPPPAVDSAARRRGDFQAAYDGGMAALVAHDTAAAIARFTAAAGIYGGSPGVYFNLGALYNARGELARAVQYYRQSLATRAGPDAPFEDVANAAELRRDAIAGLLNAGAQYFQRDRYDLAGDIFQSVAQFDPNHRDAWYNLSLALYKQSRWAELVPVARRVTEIDPLNHNAHIVLYNAYKGVSEAAGGSAGEESRRSALRVLAAADSLPVQLDGIEVTNAAGSARVVGSVVGAAAAAGRALTLEFTLYGTSGRLGSQTVTLSAPAKAARARFDLTLATAIPATSFRYRLLP